MRWHIFINQYWQHLADKRNKLCDSLRPPIATQPDGRPLEITHATLPVAQEHTRNARPVNRIARILED